MKKPRGGSFRADALEAQPRSAICRSSSSEALLDYAPSSHCMAAVAGGDEEVIPAAEKAMGLEKKVLLASPERPAAAAAVVAEGCGGLGKGAPRSYVGRLFSNMGSSVGVAGEEADGASSRGEEQEREGEKGKQKKKWSWLPDPEKRWPVQGW